jgi:SsrA-binding protein
MAEKPKQELVNLKNKKASYEFEFIDKFIAGIMLTGTEIKSVRQGKVNLGDAFCFFNKGELYVRNLHISEYEKGTHYNHEPLRERKLLMHKKELKRLESKIKERGYTIVVVRCFTTDRGFAKLEIALARGKKAHDKRESIKQKDVEREMGRKF